MTLEDVRSECIGILIEYAKNSDYSCADSYLEAALDDLESRSGLSGYDFCELVRECFDEVR